jgi:hypothetical protein
VNIQNATFGWRFFIFPGCTVMAGDGGVDDDEADGNGINCSGDTAEDDPLCTERFQDSHIAALKVVPEAWHDFTGWTVNGAQVELASTEPLFLTAMPRVWHRLRFINALMGAPSVPLRGVVRF